MDRNWPPPHVNVTIVAHPRKEATASAGADQPPLTINSLYGGAKLSQEADMVILLQVRERGERLWES